MLNEVYIRIVRYHDVIFINNVVISRFCKYLLDYQHAHSAKSSIIVHTTFNWLIFKSSSPHMIPSGKLT